jgi:rubrerythrin
MTLKDSITRMAVEDARRFEIETADFLRELRDSCGNVELRQTLDGLVAEETQHLAMLEEFAPSSKLPHAAQHEMPSATPLPFAATCARLKEVLAKEEASVTFYALLAERTPVPPLKRLFSRIADMERGHVEKIRTAVRHACPDCPRGERPA